jgi:uncharacterized membrane protein YbhN (UPF0104 family)
MAGLLLVGGILFAINFSDIVRHPKMLDVALFSTAIGGGIVLLAGLVVAFGRLVLQFFNRFGFIAQIAAQIDLLVQCYRSSLPLLGLCLLISVAIHALMLGTLVILAWALFGGLSVSQLGLAGAAAMLASQIPITPGGLALGEGTFAYLCHLMDPANVTTDYGSVIFLLRLVALVATLPGLFSYITYRRAQAYGRRRVFVEEFGNAPRDLLHHPDA